MPTISISPDYFHRVVKNDYADYQEAIIREFLQNSVDAGATAVHFNFDKDNCSLEVIDDGCGMDKHVLVNKLLCLGGTFKGEGESIGGFGKAKEVLFFCWDSYEIETGPWKVVGEGSEYNIEKLSVERAGTKCVVRFGNMRDFEEIQEKAVYYLGTCGPSAKMFVDGIEVRPFKVFRRRNENDWGVMYVREIGCYKCYVRKSGVTMFSMYASYADGSVVFELKGHPTEYLVANRDSLKTRYRTGLEMFVDELGKNKKVLEEKSHDLVEYYRADKSISIKEMAQQDDDVTTKVFAKAVEIGVIDENDTLEVAATKMREAMRDVETAAKVRMHYDDVILQQFLDDFWGFDCCVVYKNGKKPSYRLKSNKSKKLFQAWTQIIEHLAEDIVHHPEFFGSDTYGHRILKAVQENCLVTGFVFEDKVKGMLRDMGDGKTAVLLNPVKYRLTSRWHITLWHMVTVAVHEMAHFVSSYHDEKFTCAEGAIWDLIYSTPEIERKYNSLTALLR